MVAPDAAVFCASDVALGDIDVHFATVAGALGHVNVPFVWRAWRSVTATFTLHGRRYQALRIVVLSDLVTWT